MDKKNLVVLLIFIIIFFIIGIIIYPIFYNSTDDVSDKNSTSNEFTDEMMSIDLLSNLTFFKILVGENDSEYGPIYSEKFVTIRSTDSIERSRVHIRSDPSSNT